MRHLAEKYLANIAREKSADAQKREREGKDALQKWRINLFHLIFDTRRTFNQNTGYSKLGGFIPFHLIFPLHFHMIYGIL